MAVYVLVDNLKCQAPYFQRKILKQHGSIGRKRYYSALGQPTAIKLLQKKYLKEASWSTNWPSDLPNILRYVFFKL